MNGASRKLADPNNEQYGLSKNGPHSLMYLKVLSFRRNWRCGLVGGSVFLGVDFEVSKALARPNLSLFLCLPIRM